MSKQAGTPILKSTSTTLDYLDTNSRRGECPISLFWLGDGRVVALVSEPEGGPVQMSVTNAAEQIAARLTLKYKIHPRDLVYIEHIPAGPIHGAIPDWDLVTFKAQPCPLGWLLTDASWRPTTFADWMELGLPDPRPLAMEVDHVPTTGAAEPGECSIYTVYLNTSNGPAPLAWWCDLPEVHGERACEFARSRLSALYRGITIPPALYKPGDLVAWYVHPGPESWAMGTGEVKSVIAGEVLAPMYVVACESLDHNQNGDLTFAAEHLSPLPK